MFPSNFFAPVFFAPTYFNRPSEDEAVISIDSGTGKRKGVRINIKDSDSEEDDDLLIAAWLGWMQ